MNIATYQLLLAAFLTDGFMSFTSVTLFYFTVSYHKVKVILV